MIRRLFFSLALLAGIASAQSQADQVIMDGTYPDAQVMSPLYPDAYAVQSEVAAPIASSNRVRFLDADGTVLSTQYVASGANAVVPRNPSLDTALTFDGWVGSPTNIQAPIDIIASYHPTDGYTHYNIRVNSITGLGVTVYFYKNDGSTLTVDWGDGTTVTSTATGNATLAHTYSSAGSYSVRAAITSGSGYSLMGQGTSTTQVFGPTSVDILQSVWMRANQSVVGNYCFIGYRQLKYAIGSGITSIGANAFQNCYSATLFSFPVATSIGAYAFQSCYSATSFSFPVATSIGANAFQNCYSATLFSFPVATSIGAYAFQNCYSATLFSFPVATSIGAYAFQYCFTATSFSFPVATSIGASAFQYCTAATSFSFPVATSIGASAFQYCRNLRAVTLASTSLALIDSYAFDQDYNLTALILSATTPPTLTATNALTLNSFAQIKVPSSALSAYKAATNWSAFSAQIVGY